MDDPQDRAAYQHAEPTHRLYLDVETTGVLDEDEVWQIAWLLETIDGVECVRHPATLVEHVRRPSRWVLENTRYRELVLDSQNQMIDVNSIALNLVFALKQYGAEPHVTQFVGACPWFDDRHLRRFLQPVWHYHLICVENLLMGRFGLKRPPHTDEIQALTGLVNVAEHDPLADVLYSREIMHWLDSQPALKSAFAVVP